MSTPTEWPTSEWSWMRYRRTARSKWNVLLVRLIERDGKEYVQPFQDRNCFPHSFARGWEALFAPAEPPPEEWRN